jgi:hypothetical protein
VRRVQVDYLVDDTMCRDVQFAVDDRVNTKIQTGGRGYVKIAGQVTLYARVERIRVGHVDADHVEDEADMR